MSVIVGIKHNGAVYLGADSQTTNRNKKEILTNSNNFKIWKAKCVSNCLVGQAGYLRNGCVVRVMEDLVKEIETNEDINFEFVVTRIVPRIQNILIQNRYLSENDTIELMDSVFLFAYKDRLFSIGTDYSVFEVDDFIAVGSGEDFAYGSLLSTQDDLNPELRIVKAIKAAATFNQFVDYPFVLCNTADESFSVISKDEVDELIKH